MAVAERLRQSLFAIPGLCLVLGATAGELIVRLDRAGTAGTVPPNFETSTADARAVLTVTATATITVVTLVLTLTLVAIQLAAGQLSPRTIVNFLGDRFQQTTVGVVLGTAAFSLVALRALRVTDGDTLLETDLTVLVAVGATLASLVMLIMSVDRTANRLAVGSLVRDVAQETCSLIERRYGASSQVAHERPNTIVSPPPETASRPATVVQAERAGWVQTIDEEALLEAIPEGVTVELFHPVGTFVLDGVMLVRVDTDLSDDDLGPIRNSIIIGDHRTMQQDISFGLTRLTDIGLRALSPGVNDPNTAREVALRLAQVVLTLQHHELDAARLDIDQRHIVRHGAPTHDAFVREAFDQLRRGAADDASTLRTIVNTLDVIRAETERRDLVGGCDEITRQRDLAHVRLLEIVGGVDDDHPSFDVGREAPHIP